MLKVGGMLKQQIDSMGFHIGTTVRDWAGALDVDAPIYDNKTQKAKWVNNEWVIKTIEEWDQEEKIEREQQTQIEHQVEQEQQTETEGVTQ